MGLVTLNPKSYLDVMGSHKYGYTSPNMGYNYSYLTYYKPTYNYP